MQSDSPQTNRASFPEGRSTRQLCRLILLLGVVAFLLTPVSLPVAIFLESNSNPAGYEQFLSMVASGLLLPFSLALAVVTLVLAVLVFRRDGAAAVRPSVVFGLLFGFISLAFSLLYSMVAIFSLM